MGELHRKPSGTSMEENKFPIVMSLLTAEAAGSISFHAETILLNTRDPY
jgi:hypothetical protein